MQVATLTRADFTPEAVKKNQRRIVIHFKSLEESKKAVDFLLYRLHYRQKTSGKTVCLNTDGFLTCSQTENYYPLKHCNAPSTIDIRNPPITVSSEDFAKVMQHPNNKIPAFIPDEYCKDMEKTSIKTETIQEKKGTDMNIYRLILLAPKKDDKPAEIVGNETLITAESMEKAKMKFVQANPDADLDALEVRISEF